MRIFVAVVAAWALLPCSPVLAQEPVDTARLLAEIRASLGIYSRDVRDRTNEQSRKIAVLGHLIESADSVSGAALGQSLTRARQKLEEARRLAELDPPLAEPFPSVLEFMTQALNSPPFAASAAQVRGPLFDRISQVEEHVIQQSEALQSEASMAASLEGTLLQIRGPLRSTAISGVRAAIASRKAALKSVQ